MRCLTAIRPLARRIMFQSVAGDFDATREVQSAPAAHHVLDESLQNLEPMMATDDLRVHRQNETSAGLVIAIEFIEPNLEHLGRSREALNAWWGKLKMNVVVQNPIDGQLDQGSLTTVADNI